MRRLGEVLRQHWYHAAAGGLILIAGCVLLASRISSLRHDETWDRIRREGTMQVGMDASYPPFDLVDSEGRFVGYDVDLALEIGARVDVQVEFVSISFDGLYDALHSKRIDMIISALPHDRMLTRDVAYSHSYFNAGQVLLVAGGDDRIRSVEDLAGQLVSVELGSAAHQEGRRLVEREKLDLELMPERTPEEVIAALLDGRAPAALYDGIAARQLAAQGAPIEVVGGPLTDEPYVIAVRLDSPQLLERVNEALVQLREDGFFQRLEEKWF